MRFIFYCFHSLTFCLASSSSNLFQNTQYDPTLQELQADYGFTEPQTNDGLAPFPDEVTHIPSIDNIFLDQSKSPLYDLLEDDKVGRNSMYSQWSRDLHRDIDRRHLCTNQDEPAAPDEVHQLPFKFSQMVINQQNKLARLYHLRHVPELQAEINVRTKELETNEAREIFRYYAALTGSTIQRRALNARFEAHATDTLIKDLRSNILDRIIQAVKTMLLPIPKRPSQAGSSSQEPISILSDTSQSTPLESTTMDSIATPSLRQNIEMNDFTGQDDPILNRIFQLVGYSEDIVELERQRQRWKWLVNANGSLPIISALFSDEFEKQEEALCNLSRV